MTKSNTIKKQVVAEEELHTVPGAVIGTYEGECADANITNLNGLDITREVWENVFSSEEYKKAIENGWYIGYLGHPEDDPDCQDFRRACIVMTEGHIADTGKVYGKFNLIDTPVGRIVKAFQDAGVVFGISVRGAGDIVDNSVDPDTFVFRGFDLVTFPAFPESIPKFTAIAASTNRKQRKKYQAVCAAVKENMDGLDTVQSINIVQSCFAKQSDEYQELEAKKAAILGEDTTPELPLEPLAEPGCDEDCIDPRVSSMTKLYLELQDKYTTLDSAYRGLQAICDQLSKDSRRKLASVERITSSQIADLTRDLNAVEATLKIKSGEINSLNRKLEFRNRQLSKIQGSIDIKDTQMSKISAKNSQLQRTLEQVKANVRTLQDDKDVLKHRNRQLAKELSKVKAENLKYNQKIEAAQQTVEDKEVIISSLQRKLNETVRKQAQEKQKSPNLDEKITELESKVEAAESLVTEYQNAYSSLYANAVGIQVPKLSVTANTDVTALQNMIRANTSIQNQYNIDEPTHDVDTYFDTDEYNEDELVTL